MIRVAIVEDDERIRKVVGDVLASAKDCQCVGAFADGTTAVANLPLLAPDVILMDINLPDLSGVECVARISTQLSGVEIIMLNCNPETVSTDYDTSDKLFFEPLTLEDVLNIYENEKPLGVILQLGGQTPLNLAKALKANGVKILGTSVEAIDRAEDRDQFKKLLGKIGLPQGVALGLSLIGFFFVIVTGLLGGIIYVTTVSGRRLQCDQEDAASGGPAA